MKRIASLLLVVVLLCAALPGVALTTEKKADLVILNAKVATMVKEGDMAQAVAIVGDTIAYVGTNEDAQKLAGPDTKVIDAKGQMLTPGFADGHIHPILGDLTKLYAVSLAGCTSEADYLAAVKAYVDTHADAKLVQGEAWEMNTYMLKDGSNPGPTKEALDSVCKDMPVILSSVDHHSVWVNSKTLEMAGITKDTPNPQGGLISRNEDGTPRGMLTDSAQNLVDEVRALGAYSDAQYLEALKAFQKEANSFGVTALTSISFPGLGEEMLKAYRALADKGELTLRITHAGGVGPGTDPSEAVKSIQDLSAKYASDMVHFNTCKLFADGVTEGGTAVFIDPYLPAAGHGDDYRGESIWQDAEFDKMVEALDKAGIQVHIHAIGDGAVRHALDAFDLAQKANGARDARHTITHVCAIADSDIQRMADLKVVASLQFLWMYADPLYELEQGMIGKERAMAMYPVKKEWDAGVVVAGASDAPVTPYMPLYEIEVGVTRNSPLPGEEDTDMHRWAEQALTPYQMLEAYTKNVAFENFEDKVSGTIEAGKKADLVLLDTDILTCDAKKISDTNVMMTISNGQIVYEK